MSDMGEKEDYQQLQHSHLSRWILFSSLVKCSSKLLWLFCYSNFTFSSFSATNDLQGNSWHTQKASRWPYDSILARVPRFVAMHGIIKILHNRGNADIRQSYWKRRLPSIGSIVGLLIRTRKRGTFWWYVSLTRAIFRLLRVLPGTVNCQKRCSRARLQTIAHGASSGLWLRRKRLTPSAPSNFSPQYLSSGDLMVLSINTRPNYTVLLYFDVSLC